MTDLTNHSDDDSPLDPWTLERLLDGDEPATDDAAAPLAALIASTRRPGDAFELRGAAEVLAAFREISAVREPVGVPNRRIAMLTTVTRSKLIIAATAGALSLGAASAAALTGTLPDGAQSVAHSLLSVAPAPSEHAAVGPDATGPAAKGLCAAWTDHQASGETPSTKSVAFRNLATAAGGEDGIATYCATVLTPTSSTTTESSTTTDPATTDTATTDTKPTTSPTAKGQQTTHPGQGAAQWSSHSRTATFPGQGASHWPKADGTKPGNGNKPTTSTTTTETETATATDTETSGS